jgi:hypothetical protein
MTVFDIECFQTNDEGASGWIGQWIYAFIDGHLYILADAETSSKLF